MRPVGVVLAFLVLACNSAPTAPSNSIPASGATVVLPFGASKQVDSDLRISFAQLVGDSRCPQSVVCVWEGNGAIRLDVTTGGSTHSVTLNTAGGNAYPREASAGGYTFALVELVPPRKTPDPVPAQQYRATVLVTRAH